MKEIQGKSMVRGNARFEFARVRTHENVNYGITEILISKQTTKF